MHRLQKTGISNLPTAQYKRAFCGCRLLIFKLTVQIRKTGITNYTSALWLTTHFSSGTVVENEWSHTSVPECLGGIYWVAQPFKCFIKFQETFFWNLKIRQGSGSNVALVCEVLYFPGGTGLESRAGGMS